MATLTATGQIVQFELEIARGNVEQASPKGSKTVHYHQIIIHALHQLPAPDLAGSQSVSHLSILSPRNGTKQ